MMFHTRFNTAACLNKDKKYDTHDNVDRVSYVDSTRLVERFILEGHNLNQVRAKALRSGLYSGDMNEIEHDDSVPIPVYKQDPAIIEPIVDELRARMDKRKAENATTTNDDATPPASSSMAGSIDKKSDDQ